MPRVKVTRPHAYKNGVGVYKRGDEYDETPYAASQKVNAGFVEYVTPETISRSRTWADVKSKESPEMYQKKETKAPLALSGKKGPWYTFSDGEQMLGKAKAAEYLGVSVEVFEGIVSDVYSDDE